MMECFHTKNAPKEPTNDNSGGFFKFSIDFIAFLLSIPNAVHEIELTNNKIIKIYKFILTLL